MTLTLALRWFHLAADMSTEDPWPHFPHLPSIDKGLDDLSGSKVLRSYS